MRCKGLEAGWARQQRRAFVSFPSPLPPLAAALFSLAAGGISAGWVPGQAGDRSQNQALGCAGHQGVRVGTAFVSAGSRRGGGDPSICNAWGAAVLLASWYFYFFFLSGFDLEEDWRWRSLLHHMSPPLLNYEESRGFAQLIFASLPALGHLRLLCPGRSLASFSRRSAQALFQCALLLSF